MKQLNIKAITFLFLTLFILSSCRRYKMTQTDYDYDYFSESYSNKEKEPEYIWALTDSAAYVKAYKKFANSKCVALEMLKQNQREGAKFKLKPAFPLYFELEGMFGGIVDKQVSNETLKEIDDDYRILSGKDFEYYYIHWEDKTIPYVMLYGNRDGELILPHTKN